MSIDVFYEPIPGSWCSKCVFEAHGICVAYGGGSSSITSSGMVTTIELVDLNVEINGAGILRERIGRFVDSAHSLESAESIRAIALEILFDHFKKSPDAFLKFVADIKKQHFQRGCEFQAEKIRKALGVQRSNSLNLMPESE